MDKDIKTSYQTGNTYCISQLSIMWQNTRDNQCNRGKGLFWSMVSEKVQSIVAWTIISGNVTRQYITAGSTRQRTLLTSWPPENEREMEWGDVPISPPRTRPWWPNFLSLDPTFFSTEKEAIFSLFCSLRNRQNQFE
jgi:hypothetical protein